MYVNRIYKGLAIFAVVLPGLVFILHADVSLSYSPRQTGAGELAQGTGASSPGDRLIAAEDGIKTGMSKVEVYEVKGVPDKINRLPDLENKEQWVYKCMNSDGYEEDCLYLFFDGDRLDKIVEK